MAYQIFCLSWSGQRIPDEIQLVLRNAAAMHLQSGSPDSTFDFAHPLCEGRITSKGARSLFALSGMHFFAELGTVNGEPWTLDFLLPRGTEREAINADDFVFVTARRPDGTGYIRQVDVSQVVDSSRPTHH